MKTALFSIFVLLASHAFAGSNTATITGKTSSGRTTLKVEVQDIVGTFHSAELTIDGETYKIVSEHSEAFKETVIRDQKNGVYVLVLESKTHIFRMWMVPGTEKVVEDVPGTYHSTFAAIIEATDPRKKDKWQLAPRITIGCTLKWSI